jgi:hypothetical protein
MHKENTFLNATQRVRLSIFVYFTLNYWYIINVLTSIVNLNLITVHYNK